MMSSFTQSKPQPQPSNTFETGPHSHSTIRCFHSSSSAMLSNHNHHRNRHDNASNIPISGSMLLKKDPIEDLHNVITSLSSSMSYINTFINWYENQQDIQYKLITDKLKNCRNELLSSITICSQSLHPQTPTLMQAVQVEADASQDDLISISQQSQDTYFNGIDGIIIHTGRGNNRPITHNGHHHNLQPNQQQQQHHHHQYHHHHQHHSDVDDVLKNTAISMVEFLHSSTPIAPVPIPTEDPDNILPLPERATLNSDHDFFQYPSTAAKSQQQCFVPNTPPSPSPPQPTSKLNANAPAYESPFLHPQAPTDTTKSDTTVCTPNMHYLRYYDRMCDERDTRDCGDGEQQQAMNGGAGEDLDADDDDDDEEQKEMEMAREMELVIDMMKRCSSSPTPPAPYDRDRDQLVPLQPPPPAAPPALRRMEGEGERACADFSSNPSLSLRQKSIGHINHILNSQPATLKPTVAVASSSSAVTTATATVDGNTNSASKARRSRKRNRNHNHGDKKSQSRSQSQSQSQSAATAAPAPAPAPASQTTSSSSSATSSAAGKSSVSWCAIAKTAKSGHVKKIGTDDEKSPEVAWGIISTSSTSSSTSQKVNTFTPSPTPPNHHAQKQPIIAIANHQQQQHHHVQPLLDDSQATRRRNGHTARFQMRSNHNHPSHAGTTTTTTSTCTTAAVAVAVVSPSALHRNHNHNHTHNHSHSHNQHHPHNDSKEKCRIFVSNLPSDATDEQIRRAFAHCGEIKNTVWFPSKTDGKFYGRGLITFADATSSDRALEMNRSVVLGRAIKVEYSSCDDPIKIKPPGCRTVYLNNVPPDAQESRIREVFRHCGKIKRVRFHERDTKRTGGAFVEFEHSSACDKALALHGKIVDNFPLYVDYQRY